MITVTRIETIEACAKHLLQKLTFTRSAVRTLNLAHTSRGVTASAIALADRDVRHQERLLLAVADELRDELENLAKLLPNPAATPASRGD